MHAVHIIEFSDIIEIIQETENSNSDHNDFNNNNNIISIKQRSNYIKKRIYPIKNLADVKLKHYNPLQYKHSCPSTNEQENYHFGDMGNIIANSDGKAFISIMRKISLKSLNGRIIVVSNSPDKCKESNVSDRLADVIAYGQLNVFKPVVVEKANVSQEYFLREINDVNKEDFEKKYNLNRGKIKGNEKKVINKNENYVDNSLAVGKKDLNQENTEKENIQKENLDFDKSKNRKASVNNLGESKRK